MQPEDKGGDGDKSTDGRDEIPRQSLLSAMPKRSFFRVMVLLATLGGIIYLRERTSSIAGCMSTAFRLAPPPSESGETAIRARIEVRLDASTKSSK